MKTPKSTKRATEKSVEHKCAICSYSTKILQRYENHLRTHLNEKPFKCPECPFKAKTQSYVRKHLKNMHLLQSQSSRSFPCPESGCNYAGKQKSDLKRHSQIHSDEKSFFCSQVNCNFSTKHKNSLTFHSQTHTGEKPFVCQFESCSFAAAHQGHLVNHSRIHTKEKPFKCPEPNCEYSATNCSAFKRHQLTHEAKEGEERPSFSCPICEYSGKTKTYLSRHIKTHTLEKLFKCVEPNCNFEAKTKANLESHKLVHSDEKPFACSFESCEFRCKKKYHLEEHLKTHSEERIYKCELCPFRGKTRGTVRNHLQNVHSDARPFKCTEPKCESAFKRKYHLQAHLLVHKGEKKD